MMEKKTKWTIGFLSITGLAIALELFAVFDGDPATAPWTSLFVDNIPFILGLPVVGAFSLWLFKHFKKAYENKNKNKESKENKK